MSEGSKMKRLKCFGLKLPILGILSVLGGFLLQFTMGTFYSFGNMATYMVSYMRRHGSPNITYEEFIVVQSTWGMTQGVVMPMSGFLIEFIGPKIAMTTGAAIFSGGCALTYFTLDKELWMVAATYGFVAAFGQNIALIPTLTTAMGWFPNRRGTAMGIVVGGFGGGALIFNQIQTAIINPDNVSVDSSGPNKGYFSDPELLERVPNLLLLLACIYFVMGITGALLVVQPPEDWKQQELTREDGSPGGKSASSGSNELTTLEGSSAAEEQKAKEAVSYRVSHSVSWKAALRTKEFYLLWVTRLSVVLITQVVAALYKAFGQTFIYDDHFLSMVGAVSSVFNCSGRLIYGLIMDKTSYKVGMSIEAVLLTVLTSTFYLASFVGEPSAAAAKAAEEACRLLRVQRQAAGGNLTSALPLDFAAGSQLVAADDDLQRILEQCNSTPETPLVTKVVYAIWVWSIFVTFPGTYAMQPAVTGQTFGHRHAGTIYAFLFSADIVNNFMVAAFTKHLKRHVGYLGLFLSISVWGIVALVATLFYPKRPSPSKAKTKRRSRTPEQTTRT